MINPYICHCLPLAIVQLPRILPGFLFYICACLNLRPMRKLCKTIKSFFATLIGKTSAIDLSYADEAISIGNFVKSILSNPITESLLSQYAKGWGEKASDFIIHKIDAALPYLYVMDELQHLSPEERVAYILNLIKQRPEDGRNKDILGLVSRILRMDKPELKEIEADAIIQGILFGARP